MSVTPTSQDQPAASIRWEPCSQPSVDDTGVCAACGWPVDDHGDDRVPWAARAA
jgi:hypothetical protein